MNRLHLLLFLAMLASVSLNLACSDDPVSENPTAPLTVVFDFRDDAQGWIADFADYPVGEEAFYELEAELAKLPAPLDETQQAFRLSGNNHSDDLFMFIKRSVDGLAPNTTYTVRFQVEFASNASVECFGVGGAPGTSVTLKAGASSVEPMPQTDETSGHYRMNIDKGNQSNGGQDALVLGHVGIEVPCAEPVYHLKMSSNGAGTFSARSDDQGQLWLLIGTDSGFEATTTLYYTQIEVRFEPE